MKPALALSLVFSQIGRLLCLSLLACAMAGCTTTQRVPEVIVLVDDDHKSAYTQYRRLKAEGYRRVVILAGGELALQVKGQSGLGRISGAINIPVKSDKE